MTYRLTHRSTIHTPDDNGVGLSSSARKDGTPMTAPALVALAHGSRDPRSAATIKALVGEVRAMRPDLRIEPAFLDLSKPSFQTTVDKLVRAGYDEIVVVPLLLTEAFHAKVDVPEAIAAATARHENLKIRGTRVLGLEPVFLEVLDRQLRAALKEARVRELDALVLAAAGSSDALANQAVARLARLWGSKHKLPTVAAFASAAPPATGEAVRQFRAEGRRHIAVGSLFLAPGRLPDRAAELALEAGAVAVSEPLGADPEVARTILARYAVGAVELVPV
ncbi:MAG: sirohydrochlorin chelatase [Nocardioides sp.]